MRFLAVFVMLASGLASEMASGLARGGEPVTHKWTVDGTPRDGLVAVPAESKAGPSPVVFVFHGHGGTAAHAARTFALHTLWPEAIIVYPQGLPTPGKLTDPEGKKAGWQAGPGDQNDRDLKLFDAALAALKKDHAVDDKRIYATGHSNGGGFTYLLWAKRHDVLAAVAPSAAAKGRNTPDLKPLPALHVAGENDELVNFAWQKASIEAIKKVNGCQGSGEPGTAKGVTVFASPTGTPVWTFIHAGTHKFPADTVPAVTVEFFKKHTKR